MSAGPHTQEPKFDLEVEGNNPTPPLLCPERCPLSVFLLISASILRQAPEGLNGEPQR